MSRTSKKNPGLAPPSEPVEPGGAGLHARVAELEEVLKQKEDQLLRTLADFDNYRKRLGREIDDIGKAGKRDLLLGLLGVADSFERALQSEALKKDHPVHAGVLSIFRQLQQLLEQHETLTFASLGQRFDPNLHQATDTEFHPRYPEETITQEIQKGYLWEGRILRPAQVIVSKGTPPVEKPKIDIWE
jgi:molecular chaperone GrpE